MLPPLNQQGLLPKGIHDCTLEEVQIRFGGFQESDRRPQLWSKFKDFFREAKECGNLNGSFVTSKPEPNDIDLVLVVPPEHDFRPEMLPSEYNVFSKRRAHRSYGVDLMVARSDSEEYARYLHLFQQVRLEPALTKGIVRIKL